MQIPDSLLLEMKSIVDLYTAMRESKRAALVGTYGMPDAKIAVRNSIVQASSKILTERVLIELGILLMGIEKWRKDEPALENLISIIRSGDYDGNSQTISEFIQKYQPTLRI